MDYQEEQYYKTLNEFFSGFKNTYPLIYGIYESRHVADGMDEVAHSLAKLVKEFVSDMEIRNPFSIDEYIEKYASDYIYTGFNFVKNYKSTINDKLRSGIVPEPIIKLDDENSSYPIYIGYTYNTQFNKS